MNKMLVPGWGLSISIMLVILGQDVSHHCLLCSSLSRTFAKLEERLWQGLVEKRHLAARSLCWGADVVESRNEASSEKNGSAKLQCRFAIGHE